jgi:serine/threonine-protein kinase RsbW
MNDDNKVSITIPSSSEYVGVVRLAVSGIATRMNFTVEEIEDIKIAISEACTNAVQHAYPTTPGHINITSCIEDDKLTIEVSDKGVGFDTNILGSKEQREKSEKKLGLGLGLTFIKNLMDEADVQSQVGKGTTIRMTKQRPTDSNA